MTDVITLEDVDLEVGGRPILSGIRLELPKAETLALLGPSGSGKTSLLRLVLGFLAPSRGAVRVKGRLVSQDGKILVPPEERRLAVVFQDLALWPHMTVRQNLEFGLKAYGVPRVERDERIRGWLDRLGLQGKGERAPGALSGGERQRVAIARALVLDPAAVLFDEPLASLDVVLRAELLDLLRETLQEAGATTVYVTHEPREAAALGDRLAILEEGRLVQVGTLAELQAEPGSPFVESVLHHLAGGP